MILKKNFVFKLFLLLLLPLGATAQKHQKLADDVSQYVVKKQFKKAHKKFSDNMKKAMPLSRMILTWKVVEKQVGKYQSMAEGQYRESQGLEKYIYTTTFRKAVLNLEITVDENGDVSGLFFKPLEYVIPEYANDLVYGKEKFKVKTDSFEMPAELILPEDCDKCPVVILVHGSGYLDLDEKGGPNKVFYDLAMGLARNGIATIRYDKRSYAYKQYYSNPSTQFDLNEETIDDALSAVRAVSDFESLDTNSIFVLGHSLGGYAAPAIAKRSDAVKGLVIFAGTTRPLEDVIVDQYRFLTKVDGKYGLAERLLVRRQVKKAKKIKKGKFDKDAKGGKLMAYWPGKWWTSVADYNPVATLKESEVPALILQGESDYQVLPDKDYGLWKENLSGEKYEFHLYPGLNHLFIKGQGEIGPNQYLIPGNVSEEVINDMQSWIKKMTENE